MKRVAKVSRSMNGLWTIRVGRHIEHIDPRGKTPGETFDAVRWALISKGVVMDEIDVLELMKEEE